MLKKYTLIILSACAFFMLALKPLEASWWDLKKIPLPPKAEELNKDNKKFKGVEFDFVDYTCEMGVIAISDFYRKKLAAEGWKEKNPLAEISKIPAVKTGPSIGKLLGKNLIFEKDNQIIIIKFGAEREGKTDFSICKRTVDPKAKLLADNKTNVPKPAGPEKEKIFPVYPGSSEISIIALGKILKASYSTSDDFAAVANFYKERMPGFGWHLQTEKAPAKLNPVDFSRQQAQGCPECAQKIAKISGLGQLIVLSGELIFSNTLGQTCKIGLVGSEGPLAEGKKTIIMVDYAQK